MFKRKKQENDREEQTILKPESKSNNISKNTFKVYLKEKVGNTVATFAVFEAQRWFEEDSEIPYLRNNKLGFLEVLPERQKDYLSLDEKKINTEIKKVKDKLSDIRDLSDPAEIMKQHGNPKNWEYKLMMLEAQKRALKYDERVYMTFGQQGEKEYTFLREGSNYIPQAMDNETFTAFFPPDSKKKTFSFTHRNKSLKHGMGQKLMTMAQAAAWIFGIIFLFATGYFMFQAHTSYTDSEIVQAKVMVVEAQEQQLKNINRLYTSLEDKINEPKVIIEGVKPE